MQGFDQFTAHTIAQFGKMLRNLDNWLGKGVELAEAKKFDPDVLLSLRLVPDQYALVRQVQSACDSAKLAAARLAGKDAPKHEDNETTLAQIRERIASVLGYLEGFKDSDFDGVSDRRISLPWMQGKWTPASSYLGEFAVPNFYFHINMAYAILRANGIDLGKMSYIGSLPMNEP